MVKFALGVSAVLLVMAVIGAAVMFAGAFDVRATSEDPPLLAWAIHRTMIGAARDGASDVPPPAPITPGQVTAGFALYDSRCVMCHGGPGIARADWVAGMNPSPPFLIDAPRKWTPQQLGWIIASGIRMTGMPGWSRSLDDRQIGDLVAFVRTLPTIDAATYARMRQATPPPPRQGQSGRR